MVLYYLHMLVIWSVHFIYSFGFFC